MSNYVITKEELDRFEKFEAATMEKDRIFAQASMLYRGAAYSAVYIDEAAYMPQRGEILGDSGVPEPTGRKRASIIRDKLAVIDEQRRREDVAHWEPWGDEL